jgi:hypothetical protein
MGSFVKGSSTHGEFHIQNESLGLQHIGPYSDQIYGQACLTFDNKYLLGKDQWGNVMIYRVSDGVLLVWKTIAAPDTYAFPAIASSPNSYTFAATGSQSGYVDVWDVARGWVSQ